MQKFVPWGQFHKIYEIDPWGSRINLDTNAFFTALFYYAEQSLFLIMLYYCTSFHLFTLRQYIDRVRLNHQTLKTL